MWFDANKGDDGSVNYRAGLVVKGIIANDWLDLFTAKPSLASFWYIVSKLAGMQGHKQPWKIFGIDVKGVYAYVPASRLLPIELPFEDRQFDDQFKMERLNLSFYGVRDAGVHW